MTMTPRNSSLKSRWSVRPLSSFFSSSSPSLVPAPIAAHSSAAFIMASMNSGHTRGKSSLSLWPSASARSLTAYSAASFFSINPKMPLQFPLIVVPPFLQVSLRPWLWPLSLKVIRFPAQVNSLALPSLSVPSSS